MLFSCHFLGVRTKRKNFAQKVGKISNALSICSFVALSNRVKKTNPEIRQVKGSLLAEN